MERQSSLTNMVTNVYRTKNFIVVQKMGVLDESRDSVLFSRDTYYLRTKDRDMVYLSLFGNRKHVNGKRLPSSMYSREYIE